MEYPAGKNIVFTDRHGMGGRSMTDDKDDRARRLAVYMIESGGTVRSAADHFGISKSTVHKDDGVIIRTVKGRAKKP